LPQLLRAISGRPQELRLVQFERTADGKAISTLGIVNPSEFQQHPDPHLIDGAELAYLDNAWNALTASDPDALMSFLDQAFSLLPLLRGRSFGGIRTSNPDSTGTRLNSWRAHKKTDRLWRG
jgi:hypothetical protein